MWWFIASTSELLIFCWVSGGQMSLSQKLLNALLKSVLRWDVRGLCWVSCFFSCLTLKKVTLLLCNCFKCSDYISILYILIISWPQSRYASILLATYRGHYSKATLSSSTLNFPFVKWKLKYLAVFVYPQNDLLCNKPPEISSPDSAEIYASFRAVPICVLNVFKAGDSNTSLRILFSVFDLQGAKCFIP